MDRRAWRAARELEALRTLVVETELFLGVLEGHDYRLPESRRDVADRLAHSVLRCRMLGQLAEQEAKIDAEIGRALAVGIDRLDDDE